MTFDAECKSVTIEYGRNGRTVRPFLADGVALLVSQMVIFH